MFLREHSRVIMRVVRWLDLALVCVAFLLAHAVTQGTPRWTVFSITAVMFSQAGLLLIIGLAFRGAAYWEQFYRSRRLEGLTVDFLPLVRMVAVSFVPFTLAAYALNPMLLTGDFLIAFGGGTVGLIFIERLILRAVLREARAHGRNFRRVLVVGTNERCALLCQTFANHPEYGIRLLGLVDDRAVPPGVWEQDVSIVSDFESLRPYLRDHVVDDVFIALPMKSQFDRIQSVIATCEEIGIRAHMLTDFYHPEIASPEFGVIGRLPYITYTTEPRSVSKLMAKRTIDMTLAGLALVLLSPVMGLCALAVKLSSRGPVFFGQGRSGFHNRSFTMWKFRTMYSDAEDRRKELQAQNESDGPVFKIRKDPRITHVGRVLRKYSLDELPQLWNVLRGDMSIVGPRPLIEHETYACSHAQRRRLSMKPGLTCIWQVSGRSFIGFEQWVQMDLDYIDNWSLGLDARLMMRTIPAVLSGHGAF